MFGLQPSQVTAFLRSRINQLNEICAAIAKHQRLNRFEGPRSEKASYEFIIEKYRTSLAQATSNPGMTASILHTLEEVFKGSYGIVMPACLAEEGKQLALFKSNPLSYVHTHPVYI
ncbi:MAG: hypothetical protein K5Q00_00735 [Gammaproteobacteria bacterium]|nr:hypothetical protein [Gammaproteobacteria bacterium]